MSLAHTKIINGRFYPKTLEIDTLSAVDIEFGTIYVVTNSTSSVTFQLPVLAKVGERFAIIGESTDGWLIAQNAGQQIFQSDGAGGAEISTTEGTEGSLKSFKNGDCVELVCVEEDSKFRVVSHEGLLSFSNNWFGDGSDGSLTVTGAETVTSTLDGPMVVSNFDDLTINSGASLTLSNRCKGWLIYCRGNLSIEGTLSMSGKGCALDPTSEGVGANGLRIIRYVTGETDTLSASELDGCGTDAEGAEANQPAIAGNGKIYQITRDGGAGGAGGSGGVGNSGASSTTSCGGGAGGGRGGQLGNDGGAGSDGNCWRGGSGGGGGVYASGGSNANLHTGGSGASNGDANKGPGGGGSGVAPGSVGSTGEGINGQNGFTGAGGLLIIIVRGNITVAGGAFITNDGLVGGRGGDAIPAGGAQPGGGGGGASGGGSILILHAGTYTNSGTVRCAGGVKSVGGTSYNTVIAFNGGAGGAGAVISDQIDS